MQEKTQQPTPEKYAAETLHLVQLMLKETDPDTRAVMLSRLWSCANRIYVTGGRPIHQHLHRLH